MSAVEVLEDAEVATPDNVVPLAGVLRPGAGVLAMLGRTPTSEIRVPKLGDDVWFSPTLAQVDNDLTLLRDYAAKVVNVSDDGLVNLTVFVNGPGLVFVANAPEGEDKGCWRWPA